MSAILFSAACLSCYCRRRRFYWMVVIWGLFFYLVTFICWLIFILFRRRIITRRRNGYTTWIADTWNRTKVRIAVAPSTNRSAVCMWLWQQQQQQQQMAVWADRRAPYHTNTTDDAHRRSYPLLCVGNESMSLCIAIHTRRKWTNVQKRISFTHRLCLLNRCIADDPQHSKLYATLHVRLTIGSLLLYDFHTVSHFATSS